LSKIRLKGKYPLYTAQKHVIGAITKGFEKHKGILLAGQMGVGKTALGSSVAISLSANIVQALQSDIRPNQVTLIIAPPHLIDKWQRELLSISRNIHVAKLQRHEDVKAFMQHAEKLGAGIPKIGLIKRDMTKLGSGHEPAIVWRKQARACGDTTNPHHTVTKRMSASCARKSHNVRTVARPSCVSAKGKPSSPMPSG
jgi:hypothetical protein